MNNLDYNLEIVKAVFDELAILKITKGKQREETIRLILSLLKDYKKPKLNNSNIIGAYWSVEIVENTCKLYLISKMSFNAFNLFTFNRLTIAFSLLSKLSK